MEIWLKKHAAEEAIVAMDNNNQAVEALKAGHVDVVLMDGAQGAIFSQKNPGLSYAIIAKAEDGMALAPPAPTSEPASGSVSTMVAAQPRSTPSAAHRRCSSLPST